LGKILFDVPASNKSAKIVLNVITEPHKNPASGEKKECDSGIPALAPIKIHGMPKLLKGQTLKLF
jgi:hypothetical protein